MSDNGQWHSFLNAEVEGVPIHSVGKMEISGQTYIYYTTNSTLPTCAVYNVLKDDEKITLNYEHMQGELMEYTLKMGDGSGLPAGVDKESVFGDHPILTTPADGRVSFPVTIPRGYHATVTAYHLEKQADGSYPADPSTGKQLTLTSDRTATAGSNSILLGAMLDYGDAKKATEATLDENETNLLSDTISLTDNDINAGQSRLHVVVTLDKNGSYTFSAKNWLEVSADTERQTWDSGSKSDYATSVQDVPIDENGTATWKIRTVTIHPTVADTNLNTAQTGYNAHLLTKMSINGESVTVPILPEFNHYDYPLGQSAFVADANSARDRFAPYYDARTGTVSNTATTTLSTGTVVSIKVTGELKYSMTEVVVTNPNNNISSHGGYTYFRTYEVTVSNCKEDLTVTGLSIAADTSKQIVLSTKGVTDVEVWNHPTYQNSANNAYWVDASSINNTIQRGNSMTVSNWYTDPIRFKRQVGYMPPNIILRSTTGDILWSAKDGQTASWKGLDDPKQLLNTINDNKETLYDYYSSGSYPPAQLLVPESGKGDTFTVETVTFEGGPPTYEGTYFDKGFKWRRSAALTTYRPAISGYFDVVTDNNWKKDVAGSSDIGWNYSTWTDLAQTGNTADDFYYFRTTEALDRYMFTEMEKTAQSNGWAHDGNMSKVYLDIISDAIQVNVAYENGLDLTYADKPLSADTISNMPPADNGGYNVDDKRTVVISPLIPQTSEEGIIFSHWELWAGDQQIQIDGKPVTYLSSQSVTIDDVLEAALKGKFNLSTPTVTVTLKAVWKKSNTKTAVNYNVIYWIPKEAAQSVLGASYDATEEKNGWYPIRDDEHYIVEDGLVVADLHGADGDGLSAHVTETLNGQWRTGQPDYTMKNALRYKVAYGNNLTAQPAKWTIKANDTVDLYMDVIPSANITVKQTWLDIGGDEMDTPPVQNVSVMLQSSLDGVNWTDVANGGYSLSGTNNWSTSFLGQPAYENDNSSGTPYSYQVLAYNSNGQLIANNTEIPIGEDVYKVTYTVNQEREDTSNWIWTVGITYQKQLLAGNLTVTKAVTGDGGSDSQVFEFTVELTLEDGDKPNETYGGVTFSNGKTTFNLKNGETKTIEGIPMNTGYTVTETEATGYHVTPENATGTILRDQTSAVTFTNHRDTGSLAVTKQTTAGGSADKEFSFTVTLDDKTVNGTYGQMTFINGTASFTLKPGNTLTAAGLPEGIGYTVTEADVSGAYYDAKMTENATGVIPANSTVSVTCTNWYVGQISVNAVMKWDDNDNQDGKRPLNYQLNLIANNEIVATKTANSANWWEVTFANLPEYKDGQKIEYTLQKVEIDGYTSTTSGTYEGDGFTVTNFHQPATVEVTVTKQWEDNNNHDGKRPGAVTIYLSGMAGTTEALAKTEYTIARPAGAETNTWTLKIPNLAEYYKGEKITYSVEEGKVADYDDGQVSGGGYNFTITNRHENETVTISGEKTWDDNENQDGKRPTSITINLLDNNLEIVQSKTVSQNDDWKWSFTANKYENGGREITYTISENNVPEYQATVNGYDVTNSHEPGKISVPVKISWNDNENQDGKRPDQVIVKLLAGGQETGKTITLQGPEWQGSFTNLDEMKDGQKISYTVTVVPPEASLNYSVSSPTGDADKGFLIELSHTPEKIDISITKKWDDKQNQDGKRPENIELILTGKIEGVSTAVYGESRNFAFTQDESTQTWTGLDRYYGGKEIIYTLSETTPAGYEQPQISGDAANGFTVVNTRKPETVSIDITKRWDDDNNRDGKRPENIELTLTGSAEGQQDFTVTASMAFTGTESTQTWSGLDRYRGGKEITYTLSETTPTGYEQPQISGDATNGFLIVNTYNPKKIDIDITKKWDDNKNQDGIRPENIELTLIGKIDGRVVSTDTQTFTFAQDESTQTWTGLYQYSGGKEVAYELSETTPAGYEQPQISGDAANGFIVVNTHKPQETDVSVNIIWDDGNDQDGIRPETVTINIYANGILLESKDVTAENRWNCVFPDLPVNEGGQKIEYTITQDNVASYQTTVDGWKVTNYYEPRVISIDVTKEWLDYGNAERVRPKEVTIILLANGADSGRRLVLSEKGNWSGTFEKVPENSKGQKVTYTVSEVPIVNFTPSFSGDMDNGFVVLNTFTPGSSGIPTDPDSPNPPQGGDSTGSNSGNGPWIQTDEPSQPQPDLTPEMPVPQTGDAANLVLWAILMVLSGAGLTAILVHTTKQWLGRKTKIK